MPRLLARCTLVAALGSPAPALALPWWVPDEPTAVALDRALADVWPEHPVEVVAGEPHGEGLHYDGTALVLVGPDRVWRQESPPDPRVLALLARSWSRRIASLEADWVPAPPEPVEPEPAEEVPAPPRQLGLHLGVGARDAASESGFVEGPRFLIGLQRGPLWGELDLFVAAAGSQWASSLDQTLAAIAATGTESTEVHYLRDTSTLSVVAGWDPGAARTSSAPLRAGPLLVGGLTARRYLVHTLVLDEDRFSVVRGDGAGLAAGIALGAGVSAWHRSGVGVRLAVADRICAAIPADTWYGSGLRNEATLYLDVLFVTGAAP